MIMLDYDYVINLFICLDMKIVFWGVIIKNLQSKNPQNILKVKIITNIGFIF